MTRNYVYVSKVSVDWDRIPRIEGIVHGYEAVDIEGRPTKAMLVDGEGSMFQVFATKGLEDAFELAKPGMHISIEHLGKKPIKGGKTFRKFQIAVWTE